MANKGLFIDRSPNIFAAGVPSNLDNYNTNDCLIIAHPEEKAEHLIKAECRRTHREKCGPLFKRSPFMPQNSVPELLSTDLAKSRFVAFKEKFSEDMYFKKAKVGHVKECYTKPDDVTNVSRTFGHPMREPSPAYPIILPPKTAEQVNQEYADFHEKHIISHNHYFPGEQINRKYSKSFDRLSTFGKPIGLDDSGLATKSCMQQCDHLIVVSKPQMDFMDRTHGPLGKKYKRYPYNVPPDMMHGVPSNTGQCDVKMLVENITPCVSNVQLIEALGHLNKWRLALQQRPDFQMFDLISALEKSDKERTGFLPLDRIFEIMRKVHIRPDTEKIRTAVAHFNLIVDVGCATERVNYEDFCRLLSIQVPLPTTGNLSSMPANVYNKDTTYRLLCADLKKTANESPPNRKPESSKKHDDDLTRAKHLVQPEMSTLLGLGHSDFERMRPKDQLERIFKDVIDDAVFESIWEALLEAYKDQNECFSVLQFRQVMQDKKLKFTLK